MLVKIRFTNRKVNVNLEYQNGIPIFTDRDNNKYFYKELVFINS